MTASLPGADQASRAVQQDGQYGAWFPVTSATSATLARSSQTPSRLGVAGEEWALRRLRKHNSHLGGNTLGANQSRAVPVLSPAPRTISPPGVAAKPHRAPVYLPDGEGPGPAIYIPLPHVPRQA
jgi:hypothetical protein